jgi:secreted trypsin-like serine protease
VAIYLRKSVKGKKVTKEFICGGSLVTETAVITAAHCILHPTYCQKTRAKDLEIHFGRYDISNDKESDVQKINVQQTIIHPDWLEESDASKDADIAVIILKTPVKYGPNVQPICQWKGSEGISQLKNTTGTVVGWGMDINNEISKTQKVFSIPIIAQTKCMRNHLNFLFMTSDRTFCATNFDGKGPCKGDSGGGFYIKKGMKWYLRGIVSGAMIDYNTQYCDLLRPVVYVDAAKFQSWTTMVLDSQPIKNENGRQKLSSRQVLHYQVYFKLFQRTLHVSSTKS